MSKKLIMAWLKCAIDLAPMPEDENMEPDESAYFNVGIIRNNTTQLTAEDGDALQAVESGGVVVAEERQEGTFALASEVIEPDDALYANLGLGEVDEEELKVKTHVAPGHYCLRLRPKHLGAKGIKAPKVSVSVSPAFGDNTGHALTLNFSILNGEAGYWYSKYLYRGDLAADKKKVSLTATDTSGEPAEVVTLTTDETVVTAKADSAWCVAKVENKTVKIGAKANSGKERSASVTITAGKKRALVSVTQAATS